MVRLNTTIVNLKKYHIVKRYLKHLKLKKVNFSRLKLADLRFNIQIKISYTKRVIILQRFGNFFYKILGFQIEAFENN